MLAWHRHDFENGLVENVCVVPQGTEDVVYMVIKRTIDGTDYRYIEYFSTRDFDDVEDANFLDSSVSVDGTNTDTGHSMIPSGGS